MYIIFLKEHAFTVLMKKKKKVCEIKHLKFRYEIPFNDWISIW